MNFTSSPLPQEGKPNCFVCTFPHKCRIKIIHESFYLFFLFWWKGRILLIVRICNGCIRSASGFLRIMMINNFKCHRNENMWNSVYQTNVELSTMTSLLPGKGSVAKQSKMSISKYFLYFHKKESQISSSVCILINVKIVHENFYLFFLFWWKGRIVLIIRICDGCIRSASVS